MNSQQFNKDLQFGKAGEQKVVTHLEERGLKYIGTSTYGTLKDYDLKFINRQGKELTVEVKTDKYCTDQKDSGNIIVEHSSWGKEAVYTASKADIFVYYFSGLTRDNVWIIKMDKLRQLIKNNAGVMTVCDGGERGATRCIKFPRFEFKEHFKVSTIYPDQSELIKMYDEVFGTPKKEDVETTPVKKGIGRVIYRGNHHNVKNPFDDESGFITSPLRRLYR